MEVKVLPSIYSGEPRGSNHGCEVTGCVLRDP